MPVKKRRGVFNTGAVSTGNQSAWIDLGSFSKALIYLEADASGCTVTPQGTNDPDGSNVYNYISTYTLSASETEVQQLSPVPRFLRLSVGGVGGLTTSYIEGVREIG